MALKFDIARSRADVQTAILHFAARRAYRLFNAWWLDGQRMEIPQPDNRRDAGWRDPLLLRFWSGLRRSLDMDQPPRIDIELKRSKAQTIVSMKLGPNAQSVQLASALRTHLSSDAAYDPPCPVACPACGANVSNMTARYCARCGLRFPEAEDRTFTYEVENRHGRLAAVPVPVPVPVPPVQQDAEQAKVRPSDQPEATEQDAATDAVGPTDDAESDRRADEPVAVDVERAEDVSETSAEPAQHPEEDETTEPVEMPAPRRRALAEE